MSNLEVPKGELCTVCSKKAKYACPFCVEEYDTPPRKVATTFYCSAHYRSVVETGNCCYESEKIYGGMS